MYSSKATSAHEFLEIAAVGLPALEAKLNVHLRELCERNAELNARVLDLERQIAQSHEYRRQLEIEAADRLLITQRTEQRLRSEISALTDQQNQIKVSFEKNYTIMRAQLDQAHEAEAMHELELNELSAVHEDEISEAWQQYERMIALALASFHTQLTSFARSSWEFENRLREVLLAQNK